MVARIACDSKYWLWLNGKLVVFEGQLKRGPDRQSTYFDRVDLTPHLQPGKNTLAILVWYFGKHGFSHHSSGAAGLLFDAKLGEQRLVSDTSWRVRRHPAYYTTANGNPNYRLPESNVAFDASKDLTGWITTTYNDSQWPTAKERVVPPAKPWGPLVDRPIPLWRTGELQPYASGPALPTTTTDEPIVCQLPHNAQVTPAFTIDAPAGLLVRMQTDNYQGGNAPNVRAEYRTRQGVQSYESLGWMNGHSVRYEFPPGVRVLELAYRETGYDSNLSGDFRCSDERLNTLWRKAQRTLYLSMRDGYADCPGRERAQWWGDITVGMQQAFYGLDRRSDRLSRKAVLELAAWSKPSGKLFSPVPAGNWDKELPMQMLASVGRFGFWEYYRHTGDRQTIEQVYPAVNRYLALWRCGDDGLVVPRRGDWRWGDWGRNKDMPLLYNAWYYLALDGRRRMAQLLGDSATAEADAQLMQTLRTAFNTRFWTAQGYRSPEHTGPTDDRGNALAVVAGLADETRYSVLKPLFGKQQHASPYMEKYVLEALFQMGETDAAIERMLERYEPMIDSPLTTLWEGWGVGRKDYGGGSYNHMWSGGPLTLLSQYVAGINPTVPGYESIRIDPQLGRLKWVEAKVDSPRGLIKVQLRQTTTGVRETIDLPTGIRREPRQP